MAAERERVGLGAGAGIGVKEWVGVGIGVGRWKLLVWRAGGGTAGGGRAMC